MGTEGSPDIGGEPTIQRLDGEQVRIKFAISPLEDGRYRAVLLPTSGLTEDPLTVYTAGDVLAEWRAAELKLTTVRPGSPELAKVQADIDTFRIRYQELFRSKT
jgi:hypothetical protein